MENYLNIINDTHYPTYNAILSNKKLNIILLLIVLILFIQLIIIGIYIYIYMTQYDNIKTFFDIIDTLTSHNTVMTVKNVITDIDTIFNTFGSTDDIKSFILKINSLITTICNVFPCDDT